MKVLLLNQFFWPDLSATSQLLTDVARELAAQGHEVRVVCGRSSYGGRAKSDAPQVRVEHLPDLPFSKSRIVRPLSYLSFWVLCFWKVLFGTRPDVVVTLTTPPLLSVIGTVLKRVSGCQHVIWEMDVYPDLAVELGLIHGRSWSTRLLRTLAGFARRRADCVIALGECMRDRLVKLGTTPDSISIAENWADGSVFHPAPEKDWGGKLTIVYPGNLGLGHDVETLLGALECMQLAPDLKLVFVGGGKGLELVRTFCASHGSSMCEFFSYEDPARLAGERLAHAHIGLVTQKESCAGLLVPSKVYPLMAAGVPFLFIGPSTATPNRLIERFGCGWYVRNGDVTSFVETLRHLARNRDLVAAAGARARRAFEAHYDLPDGVGRICGILAVQAEKHVLARAAGR